MSVTGTPDEVEFDLDVQQLDLADPVVSPHANHGGCGSTCGSSCATNSA
jgi:FxLD family lantipeptide